MPALTPEAIEFGTRGFLRVMRQAEVKKRPRGPVHTPNFEDLTMSDRLVLLNAISAAVQLANKKQAEGERTQPTSN